MTKKKRTTKKKHNTARIAAVVGIFGIIAGIAISAAWNYVRDNKMPGFKSEADLYLRPEATLDDLRSQLPPTVYNYKALENVLKSKKVEKLMKPGHYKVERETSYAGLARMLVNGWQTPVNVTLSGSLRTYEDIASKISSQLMIGKGELLGCFSDDSFLKSFGVDRQTAYCLFIPDTYSFYWNASAKAIFKKMKDTSDAFWTEDRRAKAAGMKLTPRQVTILASIVQSESLHKPEYPKIAGVYINRLRTGQRLQADPTVAFIYGYKLDRVLTKHLQNPDPYNTYRHKGLPPGPICSPSKAAMDAVLNADTASGNLYFCASPAFNGTHLFASTYEQHLKNARAFRKEYDRRHKERLKAQAKN